MFRKLLSCLLAAGLSVAAFATGGPGPFDEDAWEVLGANLYQVALGWEELSDPEVAGYLDQFLPDGSFQDIDYEDGKASFWQPANHWRRLSAMARAYESPESAYCHDPALKETILTGIRYWIRHPRTNRNWWWNDIGIPTEMNKVFILMEKELPPSLIQGQLETLNLAVRNGLYTSGRITGQNLLWETSNHIYTSYFARDAAGLKMAAEASAHEIRISEGEGIKDDYGFFQHGNQSYAFGYGANFSLYAAQIVYMLSGTPYAVPREHVDILENFILEGQQWCTFGDMIEYTACGREISRDSDKFAHIRTAVKILIDSGSPRTAELRDFLDQMDGKGRQHLLVGTRYFPRIELFVQQGGTYFFSVKGASTNLAATECLNGENLKGYYLGLGTQFIGRSGREYNRIFPLWDWKKIPGSLVEQNDAPLKVYQGRKGGAQGASEYVDGLSDGRGGVFAYDYRKDGIRAKRSWFFSDGIVLMLTAGMESEGEDDVYLTINQCFQESEIVIDRRRMTGEEACVKARTVWQDSIGYYFPGKQQLVVSGRKTTGAWTEINAAGSPEEYSADIFTLSTNLGNGSDTGESVCYIVPGAGARQRLKRTCRQLRVLCNGTDIQAVCDKKAGKIYAAVYTPGTYKIPHSKITVTATEPSVYEFNIRK